MRVQGAALEAARSPQRRRPRYGEWWWQFAPQLVSILAEGAMTLPVTLSGGVLFAS